jgi:hypothetical protein
MEISPRTPIIDVPGSPPEVRLARVAVSLLRTVFLLIFYIHDRMGESLADAYNFLHLEGRSLARVRKSLRAIHAARFS